MKDNSTAITVLCSHLCKGDGVRPYEPSEWSKLAEALISVKAQPADLFGFSDNDFEEILGYGTAETDRIKRLIDRSGSLAFEIEKYKNIGIRIITRADKEYPLILKNKLKNNRPPLFYCAGNTKIALQSCIEYVSDSMTRILRQKEPLEAIHDGRLLILSAAAPDAGFNAGMAMSRNKFIYAQSDATVVVKSDYNKGGTWGGATECIKKGYAPVLCWNNKSYSGNMALIQRGAVPIDDSWDGRAPFFVTGNDSEPEQLTLFDL